MIELGTTGGELELAGIEAEICDIVLENQEALLRASEVVLVIAMIREILSTEKMFKMFVGCIR